jgi:hypothetical protein
MTLAPKPPQARPDPSPLSERTHILVGDAGVARLAAARVLLVGLGGVGAYAAEALARAGIGHLTLADHDLVSPSNLNRQLVALASTLGRPKVAVMAERVADINPDCRLDLWERFLPAEDMPVLVAGFDWVVDAIDSLNSKPASRSPAAWGPAGAWTLPASAPGTLWTPAAAHSPAPCGSACAGGASSGASWRYGRRNPRSRPCPRSRRAEVARGR